MGGLLKKPKVQPAPEVKPVTPMPEPDSTSALQAKRRQTDLAMQRAGRASTFLQGAPDFGSKTLG